MASSAPPRSCRSPRSSTSAASPAINLPLHWNDEDLPIGIQLVAGFGREDLLLRVAAQLEAAQPWTTVGRPSRADRRRPRHGRRSGPAGRDPRRRSSIRSGDATPSELVAAAIARIEALQPTLNALTTNRFDRATEEAALADRGEGHGGADGPFRGVPFLVKDLAIPMAGEPAHEGMRALKEVGLHRSGDEPPRPALAGSRASSSSAARTPPSSGSCRRPSPTPTARPGTRGTPTARPEGRAVAPRPPSRAAWSPAAHASDGGGSIRIPAACCGLVGLKTSRGRISVGPGSGEIARPLSVQFAVTRTVRDAAALLDVAAGPEPGDPFVAPAPARAVPRRGRCRPGDAADRAHDDDARGAMSRCTRTASRQRSRPRSCSRPPGTRSRSRTRRRSTSPSAWTPSSRSGRRWPRRTSRSTAARSAASSARTTSSR